MPSFIIKPKSDEDFYVEWSTVVDSPTAYGSRAELAEFLGPIAGKSERFDRADEYGTSMHDPNMSPSRQWFGWHEEEFIVHNVGETSGLISRSDIRALCGRMSENKDASDLLRPFPNEEN